MLTLKIRLVESFTIVKYLTNGRPFGWLRSQSFKYGNVKSERRFGRQPKRGGECYVRRQCAKC